MTYKYDSANSLTTVVSGTLVSTFEYNSDGLRTSMTVNGAKTTYLWDVNASLPVIISDTNSTYIYGLSLIARQTGSAVEYYHTDALGSVRNLTNGSGQNTGAYSYRPFGEPQLNTATSSNRFRYTGQLNDPETGSYYLRARYYQPGTGHFVSRDTFRGYPSQPQSLNLYAYVRNNPLNYSDPSGHDWELGEGGPGSGGYTRLDMYVDDEGETWVAVAPLLRTNRQWTQAEKDAYDEWSSDQAAILHLKAGLLPRNVLENILIAAEFADPADCGLTSNNMPARGFAPGGLLPRPKILLPHESGTTTSELLQDFADRANAAISGKGPVAGIKKHGFFSDLIRRHKNPKLRTEVSFKGGQEVKYGTPGSVRLDAVLFDDTETQVLEVYDLKTGTSTLTQSRIDQIRSHLPNNGIADGKPVPIEMIR